MITKDFGRELFKDEFILLENAALNIEAERFKGNELLSIYKELAESYEKLLKTTRKIFKISDTQGKDLKRREIEIKNLLDNSNQGFLTFGKDMLVNREYSAECVRIFDKKIANVNILELLFADSSKQNAAMEAIFKDIFNTNDIDEQQILLKQLPNMIKINNIYTNIGYKIIQSPMEDETDAIMIILTDITEILMAEDQVLYLSYHDKLTGLYNRAYIDSIIPQLEIQENLPLSIIMADMNGLKLANDVFGHQMGDKLLVRLGNILSKCCRSTDIVVRWGGDEFLILMPKTDEKISKKVCERIKNAFLEFEPDIIELSAALGTATMENLSTSILEIFNIAESRMYSNKLVEGKNTRRKIIMKMEDILNSKCFIDKEHTSRLKTAVKGYIDSSDTELNQVQRSNLELLATFHDIGKVGIPKEILGKPGPLTDNEWRIMQSHTEIGFRMAQSIDEPILAQAILSMREHWDGSGYPYGLKGNDIPIISRIMSVIDAFDVMTHDRTYKHKLSREEAKAELRSKSGSQFDPHIVDIFINNINIIIPTN